MFQPLFGELHISILVEIADMWNIFDVVRVSKFPQRILKHVVFGQINPFSIPKLMVSERDLPNQLDPP